LVVVLEESNPPAIVRSRLRTRIKADSRRGGAHRQHGHLVEFRSMVFFDVTVVNEISIRRERDAEIITFAPRQNSDVTFDGDLSQPKRLPTAFVHHISDVPSIA